MKTKYFRNLFGNAKKNSDQARWRGARLTGAFFSILLSSNFSFAQDIKVRACDIDQPSIVAEVVVHQQGSNQESIDLTATNFSIDPQLLTSTQNMMVAMKIQINKAELSKELIQFYDLKGVKNILSEWEYAAVPEQGPAFMINVITQENGAMGLNIGVQAAGSNSSDTDAPIQLAFVGSSLNCQNESR